MAPAAFLGKCFLLLLPSGQGCSNFAMENEYNLTVRTMDLGTIPLTAWKIATIPKGTAALRDSEHGYVGFVIQIAGVVNDNVVFGGINDAGLTCDLQTLTDTQYPSPLNGVDNIGAEFICKWALEGFSSVAALKKGLQSVRFVAPKLFHIPPIGKAHWAIRDALSQGIVIEFLGGQIYVYDDNNDRGRTGFGIMTNEPPFRWQLQSLRHLQWKQSLARNAVNMPGNWYPDDRFQRVYLVRSGIPQPRSYKEAVMQSVHILNTVTVPMGLQLGTDSGKGSGEGTSDHTQFGVIYDHINRLFYWRSALNQNIQRFRLDDAQLTPGKPKMHLDVFSGPWFDDAASKLAPVTPASSEADRDSSHEERQQVV